MDNRGFNKASNIEEHSCYATERILKKENRLKKNCYNCIHLDYYSKEFYEDNSPEGYFCNKRDDEKVIERMNDGLGEAYLSKTKSCCDPEKSEHDGES